ncbi:MAG: murein biosynthesis integral membrane protein MurJ [Actinomycetota bacterium]|nr:murein biosynthesis integral membrane protein MurJ [Actinomycetota bacterium]
MREQPALLRSSAVMAAGTTLSRLLGFVRATLVVAAVGATGLHADIFTFANVVPNMLYILIAGGIFNAVLVPQIVRAMRADPDGGEAYVNRVLTLSGLFLAGATAVLVAAAPWVMRVLAGEQLFSDALAAQTESFLDFARYCLPQVFFYGVFVLVGQVLNAHGRFGPMMWAPIANNLVAIAVLSTYLAVFGTESGTGAYSTGEELLLGLGSTLGIVVQTAVLVPYLRRAGVRYRPRFDFRRTGLAQTLRLGGWTLLFVVVNQAAYVVVSRIATNASATAALAGEPSSGYTTYSNAFLLIMVPHSIVTVSLATAALTRLSELASDGRLVDLRRELSATLRQALALVAPFCALLAVLGPFLAVVMFSWGAAEGSTGPLGRTLVAFAPALFFFTVHYLMLRGFYALEDTRTPFFVQCGIAATNVAAAVTLTAGADSVDVSPLLAVAYGAAYLVGAIVSLSLLSRRVHGLPLPALLRFGGRLLAAAGVAGVVAWLTVRALLALGADPQAKPESLAVLAAAGLLSATAYIGIARALGLGEVTTMLTSVTDSVRRRVRGRVGSTTA